MSSHVHIGLYDALREAGASEDKARIAAADFPLSQHLASKEDLLQAIVGVNDRIAGCNDRIGKVEAEIGNLRGEVKAEIGNLRGEVKAEIAGVRTEIANFKSSLYWTAWILGVSIVTVIFTLTKLFP